LLELKSQNSAITGVVACEPNCDGNELFGDKDLIKAKVNAEDLYLGGLLLIGRWGRKGRGGVFVTADVSPVRGGSDGEAGE